MNQEMLTHGMLWIKIDEIWFTFSFKLKIFNISKMQAKNHEIYYTLFVYYHPSNGFDYILWFGSWC